MRDKNPGKNKDEILDLLGAKIEAECVEMSKLGWIDPHDSKLKMRSPDDLKERLWGTRDTDHLKEKIRNDLRR